MNKLKPSIAASCRILLNVFLIIALVALASLIGVGGAALWIYGRPETVRTAAKPVSPRLKADLAATDIRNYPRLTPVRSSDETPAQLTAARYVPADSEIATLSDTPRYTYISYNGGRQQAHLRVNTVLSASVPAPLVPSNDTTTAPPNDRPLLNDAASHYITDEHGRVIGIDGTAGVTQEARAQPVSAASTIPVQPKIVQPEVRVAYPVVTRKALPVDDESAAPTVPSFDVQSELSREDDRPVLRAQPVARSTRPSMFGASDNFHSFGRD